MHIASRAALLLALLGCSAPPAQAPPPATPAIEPVAAPTVAPAPEPIAPASTYLTADFEHRLPRRARIVRYGAIRFALDGPDTGRLDAPTMRDPRFATDDVVAVARPSHVRLVVELIAVRLLVWVPRADLAKLATHRTTLALAPDGAPPASTGVTVDAGFAIDAVDGSSAYFEHDDGLVGFRGWLPLADVDEVYEPSPAPTAPPVEPPTDTQLRPGATILASPTGGEVVARVISAHPVGVYRVGAETADHILIEYAGDDFAARGYVAAGDISAEPPSTLGYGGGFGTGRLGSKNQPIELPRDTCLYADGGDEPIGVVTEKLITHDATNTDGAWHLRLRTSWGPLEVGIRPLDASDPPTAWQVCPPEDDA